MQLKIRLLFLILTLFIPFLSESQGNFRSFWINECTSSINLDSLCVGDLHLRFDQDGLYFTIGEKGTISRVWGGSNYPKGVYPDERLSSIFARRIEFEELDLQDGTLTWIFTGPRAGVTLEIDSAAIRLKQRFYDSYGLLDTSRNIPRLIERDFVQSTIAWTGILKNVTVSVDHGLKLKLFLNNILIATQLCFLDITRHQLKFTSKSGNIVGSIKSPVAEIAEVQINPEITHQKMTGFGGIASIGAYRDLSHEGKEKWWKYINDYNLLIQREYPNGTQLKEDYSNWDNFNDATIHYYGDNFPNGEISDFSYNKTIQDMGGLVIFEFWDFPPWMTRRYEYNGRILEGVDLIKYTEAIVNYCRTAENKTGRPPAIVGIQNEKNQSPLMWQLMTSALRKALDENGFEEVTIHMHNSGRLEGGIEALKAFTAEKDVWEKIDFAATNMYDYQQYFTMPDDFDKLMAEWKNLAKEKPFISTELCINNPGYQHESYRLAFQMGQLYHKNLTLLDALAIIYCWSILNGPHSSFDGTRSLFKVDYQKNSTPVPSSHQLRVFGSYSRNIKKDMVRIEAMSTDRDLLATCFEIEDKRTLVLLNRGINPKKVSFEIGLSFFNLAEICDQFSENRQVSLGDISEGEQIKVQPGQIVTLIAR